MKWINILDLLPEEPGKYIVETKTSMGNVNKFQARFNGKSFDVRNQVVVKWLKEN